MSQPSVSGEPLYRPYSFAGALLSYLVPGLGQILQGRVAKGLLFLVCLLSLFHVGQAMGNWQNVYLPRGETPDGPQENPLKTIVNNRWHFAGQFWIGIAAWPAIWQYYQGPVLGAPGNAFWQTYQTQPKEADVNEFFRESDKTPDLGWIYTVIAGMLNILVIYDAFAGPAYGSAMSESKPKPPREEAAVT